MSGHLPMKLLVAGIASAAGLVLPIGAGPAAATTDEAWALWAERPVGVDELGTVTVDEDGTPHFRLFDEVDRPWDVQRVLDARPDAETVAWREIDAFVAEEPGWTPDALESTQWAVERHALRAAWTHATGDGVLVAVLDTGVNPHTDLDHALLPGFNARFFAPDRRDTTDVHGHGTHVAGIIAAAANGTGIVGVAPDVRILPVKVLGDDGFGSSYDIAVGIRWAVDNGADVINMSLGGSSATHYDTAVRYAESRGVSVVAAAGNRGADPTRSTVGYPAALPESIAVAATRSDGAVADFSSRGPEVDVAAPGQHINSTLNTGSWGHKSGTSMAAPFVAGVVALVREKFPDLGPAQIRSLLASTADDIDAPGFDISAGHGEVNIFAALGHGDPRRWNPELGTVSVSVVGTDLEVSVPPVNDPLFSHWEILRGGSVLARTDASPWVDTTWNRTPGRLTYTVRAVNHAGGRMDHPGGSIEVADLGTAVVSAVALVPRVARLAIGTPGATHVEVMTNAGTALGVRPVVEGFASLTLPDDARWDLRARVYSRVGVSGWSALFTVDLTLPAPRLQMESAGPDLRLTIGAVAGATGYRLWREGIHEVDLPPTTTTTWTDRGRALVDGAHLYQVSAIFGASVGPRASLTRFVTVAPTFTAAVSRDAVDIAATAVHPASTWMVIVDGQHVHSGDAARISLRGLSPGRRSVIVVEVRPDGNQVWSDPRLVDIAPAKVSPSVAVDGTGLRLDFSPVPGAARYVVSRNGTVVATISGTRYADQGRATDGGAHTYSVRAVTADGVVGPSGSVSFTVRRPGAPSVRAARSGRTVTLTVTGPPGRRLVYRNGVLVASSTSSRIVLTGQPRGSWTYTVRVTHASGTSSASRGVTLRVS